MRRKSERSITKRLKVTPEKKVEKLKRTRSRRKKNSSSSENDSAEDEQLMKEKEVTIEEVPKELPKTPVKESSLEESQEQVWQVKTSESSSDTGEIKKLKICLTRPPSTPERIDRSPRGKRKHSRATSSSDTPSFDGMEDREKKKKRQPKKSNQDSKDDSDGNHDSHGEEVEIDKQEGNQITQSTLLESKINSTDSVETENSDDACKSVKVVETIIVDTQQKIDADTTVISPQPMQPENTINDKTDLTEIHIEENKVESFVSDILKENSTRVEASEESSGNKVSINEDKIENNAEDVESLENKDSKVCIETNVVESTGEIDDESAKKIITNVKSDEDSNSVQNSLKIQEISNEVINGQPAPVNCRKRKWGSRSSKLTSQKSITISTDILKDIIPDVKPVEFEEVVEEKKHKRIEITEKLERPILPKIIIDNTENVELKRKEIDGNISKENNLPHDSNMASNRKISIVKDNDNIITRPPSPPRHKPSSILYITNLVRPFTLPQLKNLLQRTGRIVENGFWIDRIKSRCFVKYENEDQAVETRHALHGVTWPISNPKTLQVDFSNQEAFDKAKLTEESENTQATAIPGTVEEWLREQDLKREQGATEKPWERKSVREWDVGKNEKDKDKDRIRNDDRMTDRRRHRTPERSPEPAKKFKKKEEEAPAKLLDDLFRKTKSTPCIYWLPLSPETIAVKEGQRRLHMAEHEKRLQEIRRTQRDREPRDRRH